MVVTMVGSKAMKRRSRRKNKSSVSTIASLPNELVTDVLARVAASSSSDYVNVKLSCKLLNELAEDNYIFQRVSLEKFPVILWHVKNHAFHAASFLKRCKESGNPEALYRQGVVDYFQCKKTKSGLDCLKRAAKSGHMEASYVLAMLLICSGEEFDKKEGIEILNNIMFSKVTRGCRKKLKDITNLMWMAKKVDSNPKPRICTRHHQLMRNGRGWHSIESEDDELPCQDCRYDREVHIFRKILRH